MVSSSSGVSRSQRFLLRHFGAEDSVAMLAARMGWVTTVDLAGDERRGVPRRMAWQVSPGLTFNYFRDDTFRVSYISFMSSMGQEIADHLTNLVKAQVDVLDDTALLLGLDGANGKKVRVNAVIMAGIGAPREFDERFFSRILSAAGDGSSEVRRAAVHAIFHTKWQEFTETLTKISRADPKRDLREFATRVLAAFPEARS